MPVSSYTEHWIKPDALNINLNHFGDPDYLQVSVLAGAVVMAFKQDIIGYNAAHNYRTWLLEAANTYLETSSAYNVYARLTHSEVNARALVIYDPILRDIEGREITYEKNEETGEVKEILGEPNENFYFIFLGQLSSSISEDGRSVLREWTSEYRAGSLETNEQQNDCMAIFNKMFRPHYDDPLNPDTLTWIEAKAHMGIAGGLTSFIDNGTLKLPSIYDGLTIDNDTIYWEEVEVKVENEETGEDEVRKIKTLKAKTVTTLGGLLNVGEWADQIPESDRIMVQKAGSKVWEGMDIANIGTASFENIEEYGEGNAFTSFLVTEGDEGEKLYLIKDKMFVEQSYLEENYFTKDDVSGLFVAKEDAPGMFVTLDKTSQYIEGVKNFIGELQINGCPIEYDSTYKYWKFTGDLVVTGGIASFSSDTSRDFASIMDGVVVDGRTILNEGGILMLNPELTLGGEGGGEMNTVAWGNIQGKPTTIKGYGITDAYTKTEADELLAKKWTVDNAKIQNWDTAFGWGDHNKAGYTTKKYVDDTFVTIGGETVQNITGAKNFTGGLQVNDSPIVYNKQHGYWKLEGDLVITGGIASFSSDMAYDPISIMDGILTDDVTIRVNETTKKLEVIGGGSGGGLNETQVRTIVESYNYLTSVPVASSSVKGIASFSSDFSISDGHVSFNGAKVKVVGASDSMNESGTLYIVV